MTAARRVRQGAAVAGRRSSKVHFQSQQGRRYRVVYSPASRIVWALEPAGDPSP